MGFLLAIPEPSEEEKAQLRTMIGELPFLLRKAFVQIGKEAGKSLPYRRGKPTPERLKTEQQKKEAAEDVGKLLSLGVEKSVTFDQIGEKYRASDRTIRRLWKQYCEDVKSAKPSGS